jgi:transposase InsO family protein
VSKGPPAIEADFPQGTDRVSRALEPRRVGRGEPADPESDIDSPLTSMAFPRWARENGVAALPVMKPGRPMRNALAKSLNGRLAGCVPEREPVLPGAEAGEVMGAPVVDYNARRPHGPIGPVPRAELVRRI